MRNAGNGFVNSKQEMNNGVTNLSLGGMHLKRIIFLKFRSKNRKTDRWELT